MRDLQDIEDTGRNEVLVLQHKPRNSTRRVRGVFENKTALAQHIQEHTTRLSRPHMGVQRFEVRRD